MLEVAASFLVLLAVVTAWFAAKAYRFQKALAELKPGPIGDVQPGEFVHVVGNVTPVSETLTSPHLGRECVYYQYVKQRYRSGKDGGWQTEAHEEDAVPFLLQDGTGSVRVEPRGARLILEKDCVIEEGSNVSFSLEIAGFRVGHGGKWRTIETVVEPDDTVRVVGQAHGTPQRPDSRGVTITVSKKGAPIFLISDKPKAELLSGFAWRAWAFGAVAVLFLLTAGACLVYRTDLGPNPAYAPKPGRPLEMRMKPRSGD